MYKVYLRLEKDDDDDVDYDEEIKDYLIKKIYCGFMDTYNGATLLMIDYYDDYKKHNNIPSNIKVRGEIKGTTAKERHLSEWWNMKTNKFEIRIQDKATNRGNK